LESHVGERHEGYEGAAAVLTATVCVALSGAGLAVAVLTAWRRRFRRATRIAAFSLLPVGLYMAGLVPLGSKIGRAFGTWAADLVFDPTVWAGFAVIALAVVLYAASRIGRGRSTGARESRPVDGRTAGGAVAPASSAPAISPAGKSSAAPERKRGKSGDPASEFDDIEAILRKHGI
jgi:hypothetical protein